MQPINPDTMAELIQIGFLANIYGSPEDSSTIFHGICAIDPDNIDAKIGLAVAYASNEDYGKAAQLITNNVLAGNAEYGPAKCLLGWIYLRMGNTQYGKQVLSEVEKCAVNKEDIQLAASLLNSGLKP